MPSIAGHHLPGAADGAVDGWQERAVQGLNSVESNTKEPNGLTRLSSQVHWKFLALVRLAARTRGISVSGYIRRAVAAFVAHDLQMEFGQVTQFSPGPNTFGQKGSAHRGKDPEKYQDFLGKNLPDDGVGYGKWEVAGD